MALLWWRLKWTYWWPALSAFWFWWEMRLWWSWSRSPSCPKFLQCQSYYYNPDLHDPAMWRCCRARWHRGHHV